MLPDLLPMLPQSLDTTGVAVAIAGVFIGAMFWLTGGVWSRWIVTLAAVAAGGTAGMLLPRWYLWPVNSMSIAVLGAVVLGVLAFVGHRVFVGVVLGLVLVSWAVFGTWLLLRGDAQWQWRQDWEVRQMDTPEYAHDFWQRLPEPVQRVVPYAAAAAMISGLCVTLLWPRVGRVLMGATVGLTMLLLAGLTLILTQRSAWLGYVPPDPAVQLGFLAALLLLGTLIQWQLLPSKREVRQVVKDQQEAQRPIRRYEEIGAG